VPRVFCRSSDVATGPACPGGASIIVVLSGEIMTMPRLPQKPASDDIDIKADGNIVGLA
jgi:formyltetrahydrofolate synthetase